MDWEGDRVIEWSIFVNQYQRTGFQMKQTRVDNSG
jgi:hypothetical protein